MSLSMPGLGPTPQQPFACQLRSIDFDMSCGDAITFTFSLPVDWVIILAAPGIKRHLRTLRLGSAVMAAVEVALLLAFAYITARDGAAQMAGAVDPAGRWIRHVGVYLVASVLPYAAPFVVALSLHRELREHVFAVGLVVGRRSSVFSPRFSQFAFAAGGSCSVLTLELAADL